MNHLPSIAAMLLLSCLLAACGGGSSSDASQAFFTCTAGDATGIEVQNLSTTQAITRITVKQSQLIGDPDFYSIPVTILPGTTETFCMPVGSLYSLGTQYEDGSTGCVEFRSFPGTRICPPGTDGSSLPFQLLLGETEELDSSYRGP